MQISHFGYHVHSTGKTTSKYRCIEHFEFIYFYFFFIRHRSVIRANLGYFTTIRNLSHCRPFSVPKPFHVNISPALFTIQTLRTCCSVCILFCIIQKYPRVSCALVRWRSTGIKYVCQYLHERNRRIHIYSTDTKNVYKTFYNDVRLLLFFFLSLIFVSVYIFRVKISGG